MNYPKWLYHKEEKACIVEDENAHKEKGAGWQETPCFEDKVAEPKTLEKVIKKVKKKASK